MKRLLQSQFMLTCLVAMMAAVPVSAQPLLQWTFDESSTGSQDAIDSGVAPAESGIFQGGATRTSNTPNGASTGAADLFGGAAGTNAFIQASNASDLEGLSKITITTWVNLQADPVGNDRIVSLQAAGTPHNADFDVSDLVDGADFLTWQRKNGTDDGSAFPEDGDATGDGNVDAVDLEIWERQFGAAPILPEGAFAGFSFNFNGPNTGTYAANDFRVALFMGGLDSSGVPVFDFAFSDADVEVPGGNWIFLAATYDGSTQELTYYVGTETVAASQLGTSFTLTGGLEMIETTGVNFYAGKTDAAPGGNTSPEGFMDDVRIYDSALDLAALDAVRQENLALANAVSSSVPEPSTLALSALVALGGIILRRRRS